MIPTVEDLRSAPMVHRFGDLFNPPGLTNFLGCVQVDLGVTAIRGLSFPPFSIGDTTTAGLFVNDRYFPSTGAPVTFTWWPDRIVREAEWDHYRFRSTTVLAHRAMAAVVVLQVENLAGIDRTLQLRLAIRGGPVKAVKVWDEPTLDDDEFDFSAEVDRDRKAVVLTANNSSAVSVQGTFPRPDRVEIEAMSFEQRLRPGERFKLVFVDAIGETAAEALATFDRLVPAADAEVAAVREDWNAELEAMFTPGNDRYGGSLPVLETDDDEIRRLYLTGALGVAYFKRDTPHSVIGRTYDTLMPRYWQSLTFLWDYSLSSLVHALLDPAVMRTHLQWWMGKDVHTCMGTEWLTGAGVGQWYSVNDYAMLKMARDYLRFSGDHDWLAEQVTTPDGATQPVVAHLRDYASTWERFRTPHGLADYGGIDNLLECVSTYIHEIAGMNAANVFNLRFAGDLAAICGDFDGGAMLQVQAKDLATEVLKLYEPGKGYFNARFPDGRLVPVRHCYDFFTVLTTMPDMLSLEQWEEMASFFVRELQTPTWMSALSTGDPDATFNVRPDHQWTGAYTAWPALAAQGLYNVGKDQWAFAWLKGLARSANQGPFGQAHFTDTVIDPEAGGARKTPPELPWATDWACSSGGAFCSVIIESLFGVHATLADGVHAFPRFGAFDADARLRNLQYQGKLYDVDRTGIRQVG
ncbi:MAG TPA: hypothetical protein VGB52_14850 [Actinomycetota bacterium]